tara:strand:+ start:124 stop:381 length:258 start_codon:yes stop_codon:yes gene_type:complete
MSDKYRIRIEQNGEGLTDYIIRNDEGNGILECNYEYIISNEKILNQYKEYKKHKGDIEIETRIMSFINDELELETHSERIIKNDS